MEIHAVPQWQGALAGNAGRLPRGCEVLAGLAGDVLGPPVHTVPVEADGSATVDGVGNRDALIRNRSAQLDALEHPEGPVLTVGGDCGVDLVPVGVARYRYGDALGVAWFDAHGDLNTAESSPSGAFHGMVLRSLFGQGDSDFAASPALEPGRAVLVGARDFDPAERRAVDEGLVRHVPVADTTDLARVRDGVRATGTRRLYVHVDLDVLDPDDFPACLYRMPGGLTIAQLVAALDGLAALDDVDVVGASVVECTGESLTDVRPLVPVFEALGRLLA